MRKNCFVEDGGYRFYALVNGEIAKNQFVSRWGAEYLFGADGRLLTGKNSFEGNDYYSKENGKIVKSSWIDLDDDRYYAKADSKLAKNETIKKWGKKYTFDADGRLIK